MSISPERLQQLKTAASNAKAASTGKGSQHVSVPADELVELCDAATPTGPKAGTDKGK